MLTISTNNLSETKALALEIAKSLKPVAGEAMVVALFGDLGAGKTSFVQGLAEALGVGEKISSPTFVIEKIYDLDHQSFRRLIHIDTYRLETSNDLLKLGFADIVSDSNNLIVIEWPEKVLDILPETTKKIYFKFIDDHTREIKYESEL